MFYCIAFETSTCFILTISKCMMKVYFRVVFYLKIAVKSMTLQIDRQPLVSRVVRTSSILVPHNITKKGISINIRLDSDV